MEGAAITVYAQGGRGNARLVAWEGERTVTFTMEDALISPAGIMILTGAGLIEASSGTPIYVHTTEQTSAFTLTKTGDEITAVDIELGSAPAYYKEGSKLRANEDYIYVMVLDGNGEVNTEPFIATVDTTNGEDGDYRHIVIKAGTSTVNGREYQATDLSSAFANANVVLVDYYVEKTSGAQQINITPDKFGGNYYLEASTLFRDNATGVDLPAEFIIPNCKIQSNFTFTMASSGDPSTFTFTMDAFPAYTRFDLTKKVLAAIQVVTDALSDDVSRRDDTSHSAQIEEYLED